MSRTGVLHEVLTIRASQMDDFRRIRLNRFIGDMVAYLAAEYPLHFEQHGPDAFRALVERTIEAAGQIGVTTQGAIGVLTELHLVYGENLERAPDREWARNILAHKMLPGYIKVEAVQNRMSEKTGGRVLVAFPGP